MFVGNATQAGLLLHPRLGFTEIAYLGLETGSRDKVSTSCNRAASGSC